MPDTLTFTVPLPPPVLRANSRAHWHTKKKAADAYSVEVWQAGVGLGQTFLPDPHPVPWERAHVRYEWRYAGVEPDHGNLGGHTKYLQDIICMAPKLSPLRAEKYKRWHLGIVEDDRGITAEYQAVKVKTKAEERVVITIERQP